ncbi:protein BTR1-like isoform X1 [Triticum dicoccoides]|uniref:protein BTR1-like isoform X1 n=1 Tax=Triticum dicoccoides TaxID=85692 RepID=UPI0002A9E7C9|nr:protein BTR1-like isoform X1 [Triticum dicoccoides]XP_044425677.1 protein BTR1-like isoform X1 [Triticum aestivum]
MDPAADDGRSPSPVPDPDDGEGGSGWGSDKPPPTRAEEGRVVGKAAMEPSPSPPDSTVSDQDDDDLTRAVSLLSLAEAGKAGSAPRAVDPSPPSSAVSSHGHKDDDDLAGVNKRTHARFLVTHAQAGLIIGMGGSTVAAVEARSGARVKLSRHDQLLPGTDRRVVLVHGLLSQVMDAMELLLQRLLLYQVQGDQAVDSEPTLVLVVPQPCCGVLIGKGGSVIKSFTEASETAIQISPHNISYGFNDRLVTITGPLDNLLRAVFLIIFELLEDIRYLFPCAAATPNIPMRSPVNKDAQESVTIAVADEHMGSVIGRGGRIVNEISKVSGAWIDISGKGEFMPGTRDREVIMRGTSEAIRAAEAMIMHRVSVASGNLMGRRVEGTSVKGLLTRLDEEEEDDDAVVQMHRLKLSDRTE